jgi:hypothetical protein
MNSPRQQAIAAGLTKYMSTTPCKRGHIGERHVSGRCIECTYIPSEAKTAARAKYRASKNYQEYLQTDQVKLSTRRNHLLRNYGITLEQHATLLAKQDHKCAICFQLFIGTGNQSTAANLDHCHSTGNVRGLLCGKCNKMIGLAKDDILRLQSAINYLQASIE